jgi:hypothetical protein
MQTVLGGVFPAQILEAAHGRKASGWQAVILLYLRLTKIREKKMNKTVFDECKQVYFVMLKTEFWCI